MLSEKEVQHLGIIQADWLLFSQIPKESDFHLQLKYSNTAIFKILGLANGIGCQKETFEYEVSPELENKTEEGKK